MPLAAAGLILSTDLALDGVGVSDDVTHFSISITTEAIEVPATASRRNKSWKPGAQSAEITISWLQSEDASNIQSILYAAMTDGSDGLLAFSGKIADNSPYRWAGEFVVTGVESGGDVWTIGTSSMTFPCVALPTRSASGS